MDLKLLGKAVDYRTNSHIIYGQISINDYLMLIGGNYDEYGIQRKKEKHKAYIRMRSDLTKGALLPTITLAINQKAVNDVIEIIKSENDEELLSKLKEPGIYSILDGLQRTIIMNEIKSDGGVFNENQKLLIEFWAEPEVKHLIYRLIVLNAGQKPMTLRHQLELLFMSLSDMLKKDIQGIEFYRESENKRRTQSKQYQFDRLVSSYQSFLIKTPELKKDNLIAQKLLEDSILDSSEDELTILFSNFVNYLKEFVEIDDLAYMHYIAQSDGSRKANWIATENVMNSFFAAIADFSIDSKREDRINYALLKLKAAFLADEKEKDPFFIDVFNEIIQGFETSKINVGVATRRLLTNGFKEYFREEGEKSLKDIWISEAK